VGPTRLCKIVDNWPVHILCCSQIATSTLQCSIYIIQCQRVNLSWPCLSLL